MGIVCVALYMAYRRILPKPIPDIPYNKDAAAKMFGDVPEMMGYVMRTQRIFVRTQPLLTHNMSCLFISPGGCRLLTCNLG